MLDHTTQTLAPDYFRYLLELEGNLAVRHLYYLSLLDFELDITMDEANLSNMIHHIRLGLRKTDMIGRLGPLRFCVVLIYAECNDAFQVAQRIQKRVEKHPMFLKRKKGKGRISLGGACFPTHASTIQMLPNIAERMLATAKKNGGNRIYFPID